MVSNELGVIVVLLIITIKQGGRSWQAFGERKKCLQFFR